MTSSPQSPSASRQQNVLLLVADDMSAYMMGIAGSSFYETPHLDRLASEGILFTQAYGTGPVCSPSRASLMTGKHPARLHLTNYTPGSEPKNAPLKTPDWTPFLPITETTLGNLFSDAGFVTGHFGKWHLNRDYRHSPNRPMDPETQGFQHVFTTVKPQPDQDPRMDPHNARAITEKTKDFLSAHQGVPFFCVVEHNLIHRPEIEDPDWIQAFRKKEGSDQDFQRPELGALVKRLDWSAGEILDHLDALGLTENTLVVFTADHGTPGKQDEDRRPLRGAKASLYEGGIRVPLILRQPGTLEAGRVFEEPVTGADLAVTLGRMADSSFARERGLFDGVDIINRLSETAEDSEESRLLAWHFPHYHHQGIAPCGALRQGRYKLIEWFEERLLQRDPDAAFELYDLKVDPREKKDLSSERPELVRELSRALDSWRQEVGAQQMAPNPAYQAEQPTVMTSPGH